MRKFVLKNSRNFVNVMLRLVMYISQAFRERKDLVVSNKLTKIYEASNEIFIAKI